MRGSTYLYSLLSRAGVPGQVMRGSSHCSAPQPWPPPCSPIPTQGALPFREIKCCSSQQQGWEFLIQSLHRLRGSLILALIHLAYRKFPGKKVKNSVGNICKYVHCHFLFTRKNFKVCVLSKEEKD